MTVPTHSSIPYSTIPKSTSKSDCLTRTQQRHERLPPRSNKNAPIIPKQTFRERVDSANPTAICTSTSRKVGRRTIRKLFESRNDAYNVPIFQRRYCWTRSQWETLWNDIVKPKALVHSLGRLTCTDVPNAQTLSNKNEASDSTRSIIIDGQQRFTTITLLLASIRDALMDIGGHPQTDVLIQSIHQMLFLDPLDMKEWVDKPKSTLSEGVVLNFCRLIPTYCDRSAYFAGILPPKAYPVRIFFETNAYNPLWHRPIVAKEYFNARIRSLLDSHRTSLGVQRDILQRLLRSLLDCIDILFFPISNAGENDESTNDTQIIYERLAIRDATWCKPRRESEYHSMDGSDMIRNLLLGSFRTTDETTEFYKNYWLPLERMCRPRIVNVEEVPESEKSASVQPSEEISVHDVIRRFLVVQRARLSHEEQRQLEATSTPASKVIGGRLYRDFEAWMTLDYHHFCQDEQTPRIAEEHTKSVGRRILGFANASMNGRNTTLGAS